MAFGGKGKTFFHVKKKFSPFPQTPYPFSKKARYLYKIIIALLAERALHFAAGKSRWAVLKRQSGFVDWRSGWVD